MKNFRFVIHPHCFLWLKGEEGLVYHAINGAKIRFRNIGSIAEITKRLSIIENLYHILLTDIELSDESLNGWIQEMVTKECAILTENNETNSRPVSLPPILKVQDEVGYYRWEHKQGIDGDVIDNLHSLVFHLNGSTSGNDLYARQFISPTTSAYELSNKDIIHFAENSRISSFLSRITLVGNPFIVKDFNRLIERLQKICTVSVRCIQEDALVFQEEANKLASQVELNIIVTDCKSLDKLPHEVHLSFIVTSETEYEEVLEYEQQHGLSNLEIIPVYTGSNLSFFEEYLYINRENMNEMILDKREIFIHQKLNSHHFGRLIVMPDGKVYADPNHNSIGNIHETPHSIVYRELTEGDSWLHIRNEKPCSDCIYQWLCPSPSGYEAVIGKPNLCKKKS